MTCEIQQKLCCRSALVGGLLLSLLYLGNYSKICRLANFFLSPLPFLCFFFTYFCCKYWSIHILDLFLYNNFFFFYDILTKWNKVLLYYRNLKMRLNICCTKFINEFVISDKGSEIVYLIREAILVCKNANFDS